MGLYLLYSRHGGNQDEEEEERKDPLKKPEQMRKQLAEFKHLMRKIAKHAASEGDEWHMLADNATTSKLRALAVDGRAPAIRCMPVVEEEDANAIFWRCEERTRRSTKKHSNTAC